MATRWRERVRDLIAPNVIVNAPPAVEPKDLLETTLELAQTQILGQLAEETSIDSQTIGVLAFLGALLAVDVAAKDVLGPAWWIPLIPVVAAMVPCFFSVFAKAPLMGPRAHDFYTTYGASTPSRAVLEQMLSDLSEHFRLNGIRATEKRKRLRLAVVITFVGLGLAVLPVTLDRPTTIKANGNQAKPTSSARNSRSSFSCPYTAAAAQRGAAGYAVWLAAHGC